MRDGAGGRSTGLRNFRWYTWWSLTASMAVFLLLYSRRWVRSPDVVGWPKGVAIVALVVLTVAAVVLFSLRVLRAARAHPAHLGPATVRWLVAGSLSAVVLGVISLVMGDHELWSLAPATMLSIIAVFLAPGRRRILIASGVVAAAVIGAGAGLLAGESWLFAAAFPAGMVAVAAWATLGMLWAWDVAERLDQARELAAEVAVKDERLRFAADLHDIQGHHLQVIALKAELAARLVQADPARAEAEMREVQRLSTDALSDTRAVVQGYRRTTLEAEIANAAKVLTAAGIDARMAADPDAAELSSAGRHLLGLVMRETTTNVLRHSRARHAEAAYQVSDGLARLRVANDGVSDPPRGDTGTGLAALAERLQAAGGSLTWAREGDRFEVVATLPVEVAAGVAG
ncbi:histidine kinase [Spongiactinospora sp. TRM90649]|uniref:sensor histidine kinase n=1 Tax=Spongiactinospora sp. TRM90649 TaxID=3031114 RepID=UPI0023F62591|nr:histidine kinase [Spongiactinospora sp. TRM90649]MDF5752715.1 histidine kinase [Spongiactinospora sp. TRM90649]